MHTDHCRKVLEAQLHERVTVGQPLDHDNLTIFPLTWDQPHEPPYTLLAEAIERGDTAVEEVDEEGEVPHLSVLNRADRPVLIIEGEILIGAKQNRVVNVTVIVASRSKLTLPVSCVEQRRWRYHASGFETGGHAPPSLRSRKTRSVQESRRTRASAESDQGGVWAEVAQGLQDHAVESNTCSLTDGLTALEEKLEEHRRQVQLPEGTSGIVVAVGGQVNGMELFDCPQTFEALQDRLARAYLFDALRSQRRKGKIRNDAACKFVQQVPECCRSIAPALGLGNELEISGDRMVGSALLFGGQLCHLVAFCDKP